MQTKYKVLIGAVVVLTAFAAGRFTVPEKIKEVTKIVEVEKKTEDKNTKIDLDRNTHKETHVVVVKKPDGSEETRTDTREDTTTSRDTTKSDKTTTDTSRTAEQSTEVTQAGSKVTVNALIGTTIGDWKPAYGCSISKPVFGPLSVGAFGLTNKTVGISIGLTF